jgi:hypothetical protein
LAITGQDIELWAGDDAALDITLTEDDGTTPLNLTGITLRWALADAYDKSRVLIDKSSDVSGGGIEIVDLVGGTLRIIVDAEDTASLGGQPYYHELQITDPGDAGSTITMLIGAATIHTTAIH